MRPACRALAALSAAALTCLQACTSPRVLTPAVRSPLQKSWQGAPPNATSAAALPGSLRWWSVFHDPVLDRLMREGLAHNLDLRLAQTRIAQARAQRRAASAALWPDFTGVAQDQFAHTSTNPPGFPQTTIEAAVDASWNVDLFGTLRNQRRAAVAAERASEFDREATTVTLLSEIASTYVQYRLYQLEYVISVRSADSQEETVRITRLRFEQGAASRLDVEQLVSQLAITRAAVPQALEQAESARDTLILLLASTPEALAADLPETVPANPALPNGDPITVLLTPAQVIAQRPDIRSAQLQLIAAGANLKAAEAQRYPQLTLAGLFGQEATNWGVIAQTSSRGWSYGESLLVPLFDFGRIHAAIDLADAQQQQAYLTYEQTVRTALQATQSAVVLYTQGVLREREMETALSSARTAAQLARRQYQEGALALLNVLDAERTAYSTELTWAEAAAAVSVRLITLYQTMGVLPPQDGSLPE